MMDEQLGGLQVRVPIAPLAAAALAFAGLAMVTTAMSLGWTAGLDTGVLLAFRNPHDVAQPFGPPWLQETGRDLTALGSNGVMGLMVLAVSGCLALARRQAGALLLLASFSGALALEAVLKHWVSRPRPDLVPHAARVFTTSFPSSHATVSAAVYVTFALLVAHSRPGRGASVFAVATSVLISALVCASRIYLGLHWLTDVIAGVSLGAGWAALCWAAFSRWDSELVSCKKKTSVDGL